jgi:hypothetical protein
MSSQSTEGQLRVFDSHSNSVIVDVEYSPDFARDIAFQKITNRVKGAALAREQLSK